MTWSLYQLLIDFYKYYIWHRTLALFQTKYFSYHWHFWYSIMLVKIISFHQMGWNLFCIAHLTFLYIKSTDLWNWIFEFLLFCPKKLTSPSSVRVRTLSVFARSMFFGYCFLSSSFSVALAVKCFDWLSNFHLTCPLE